MNAQGTPPTGAAYEGFSKEERLAMKERAKELKASASKADAVKEVLSKIAEMSQPDRETAERIHALVTTTAPELEPRTWYGMPAYALDGKVVCFFQDAAKFKARYSTLGFSDVAALDDGAIWPTSYAITTLDAAAEAAIVRLVKRAVARA